MVEGKYEERKDVDVPVGHDGRLVNNALAAAKGGSKVRDLEVVYEPDGIVQITIDLKPPKG